MKLKDIKDLLPKELHDNLCGEEWCDGRNEILYKMGLLELEIDVEKILDTMQRVQCKDYDLQKEYAQAIAEECPIKVKE